MKKILCATALIIIVSSVAYAGGATMEPSTQTKHNWTGFYVGTDGGYMWGNSKVTDLNVFNVSGANANSYNYSPSSVVVNANAGYDWQANGWLLFGAELQGGWLGLQGNGQYPSNQGIAKTLSGGFISAAGRLGFIVNNNILLYGKAGYAWTGMETTFNNTNSTDGKTLSNTSSPKRDGGVYGGGIEYAFTNQWSARAEYDYYDFGTATSSGIKSSNGLKYNFSQYLDSSSMVFGISYKFGSM